MDDIEQSRRAIARKVQELRKGRQWTQAMLSRRLHLSQSRLSEIERGAGSFTAEQFLAILKLFNASTTDFTDERPAEAVQLQNALARLGAVQLHEASNVLPSDRLNAVADAVREALVAPDSSRIIASLAPVMVRNVNDLNLQKLHLQLARVGLDRRLAWLVENTLEAVRRDAPDATSSHWRRLYNRVRVVLEPFLKFVEAEGLKEPLVPDALDRNIRSKQTFEQVGASSSAISKKWRIVTAIQPDDFAKALRGARVASE